jgi:DNA helicase II / ATP-dependent DNA helicase PcrA
MQNQLQLDKYNQIYNNLNPQQQQAVNAIDGAVMVIAGPGTGKTQILSARIGKILLETDCLAQNILCLTYTDAGTIAMRKRLLQMIGVDAYKVNIHTFHSFCNDVIQDNLSYFQKSSLNPISELESIDLMQKLIDNFPKNHPLKRYRGDVYYEINNLLRLFDTIKKEGYTVPFLLQAIEKYLQELPTREGFFYKKKYKEFAAGDAKQAKIDEEIEKMEKLKAAINEFVNFKELMKQKNLYDFNDMINWVIDAFENNEVIKDTYSSQFNHILIDEFQDTSGTQNKIITLLYQHNYTQSIFVVGDDDQSIYRFQGANVENMEGFRNTFLDQLQTVVLTNNYRSVQSILDASKSVIDNNNQRLINQIPNLTKNLLAANANLNTLQLLPKIVECASDTDELIFLTSSIENLLQQNVLPSSIAVIYKENKYGDELGKYLHKKNINFYCKKSVNLLSIPLAKQLVLMLQYVAAEHDKSYEGDEMLFEILHFNFFKIQPIEIAKLSVEVANRQFGDNKTSLRALLCQKANEQPSNLFSVQSISKNLQKTSAIIETLIAQVSNVTLQNLLDEVIRNTGLLAHAMQSTDKHNNLKIITAFFDFVKNETAKNPLLSLQQFVSILELMMHENIVLPLIEINGTDQAVNLLTTHGSKGLEFDYVFVAGCNAHIWEKKRKPSGGYKLPDTIFENKINNTDTEDNLEELRRLFYVALTRAAKHLHISYYTQKADGKLAEPSMFITEMQQHKTLPFSVANISNDEKFNFYALQFMQTALPQLEQVEANFIDPILDKFVMNVTALNNYLKCPLQFYYNNIIKVPSGRNEATEFGSAVHHALEQLFKKMLTNNNVFAAKETFIGDFNWYLNKHRENFTLQQFKKRVEQADIILTNYYNKYITDFNKVVLVEKSIKNVVINGVPLKGKLDKLEFTGNDINVVDYKTGDFDKAKKIKKTFEPASETSIGGDYWRQAVFYKILIDNQTQFANWKAISTEFDFIEPVNKTEYKREKISISPQDVEIVKEQILVSWQKIQDKQFYIGCGKPTCKWCGFVKTHELAIDYHEADFVEEEAD